MIKRSSLCITILSLLTVTLAAPASVLGEEVAAIAPAVVTTPNAAPATADAKQSQSATAVVEMLHTAILRVMKQANELGFDGRYAELAPVIKKTFDLGFMGSKCVGRHWSELSDEEQTAWLTKFASLTTSNYAGRFNDFTGESFVTLGEEPAARKTRVVLTKIVVPGRDDVLLNYRLARTEAGWRIIDIYLNGTVSELALRRSDYSSTLKREGFEKLVAAVDQKIAELRVEGGG